MRKQLLKARRIVVKVGTRVLVDGRGRPMDSRITALVEQLSRARGENGEKRQLVLVSSGAIGAGLQALGIKKRPKTLPDLQMAAAVGQCRLLARYDQLFSERDVVVGQVLLTHDDLKDRVRHLNARNTLMHLLDAGVLPIINENDAISVDEIKFGDNDQLAALVAMLIDADLLILLTSTNGLRAPKDDDSSGSKRIGFLPAVDDDALALANGKTSELSSGGMSSKLISAQTAVEVGVPVIIADGRKPDVIDRVLSGADIGTLIGEPRAAGAVSSRKRWIAFFQRPRGTLHVDEGAVRALRDQKKSLLPIGIREVEGRFDIGAVVNIRAPDNQLVGRGLTAYSSIAIGAIRGRRTDEIAPILGEKPYDEVIHRDNLVVFGSLKQ
jgi:glutamate 5-kinase